MMDELQELRERIRAAGHKSPASHRKVSEYISSHILEHPNEIFKNKVPPLDVVIFAIERVLSAPIEVLRIPDLLDFVTTLEFYRGLALKKADDALEKNARGGERTLTREDKDRLRDHQSAHTGLREIYIEVVFKFCQLDIYYRWTQNPPSPSLATQRLCEYFPMLNDYYSATHTSPRLFHSDLSDLEREDLRQRGLKCCRFVRDSVAWAEAHSKPGEPLARVFQTAEFRTKFPCEIDVFPLRGALSFYMNVVQETITRMQGMFSTMDNVDESDR
ncbi:hypothetical protein FB45DRAFT_889844 [Roridomyces roridus]|uniref:Uncharacterized protein n=1 Tax=Roridomyces roridus TaxID=1738132 RepID=A0AAD7CKM0_9AGAR|nr:hypothetical protein FB45DRAFT_889844 [Roridomyces roridus]